MKKVLCVSLLLLLISGCTGMAKKELINDYSDQTPKIYTLKEWQDLGFDVWKEYYVPKRWNTISQNDNIIEDYKYRTELNINEFLSKAKEEGILVDRTKVAIAVNLLSEKILPVHRWFWFPRKERVLIGAYEVMHDGSSLGSAVVYLPATK